MYPKHITVLAKKFRAWKVRRTMRRGSDRRGSALILTLVLTLSLASLATSAIYLGGNEQILATTYDQERDLRYADEAVLAMGKSTLNFDPYAAPDTGYATVFSDAPVMGADGKPIPGITTSMYLGPTSSNTGQFGRFVSVVAVAKSQSGARVVRRLELAQESFAKFAYWSNEESNNGQPIYFNNNDQLWGPVWSNDQIRIESGGARFHGSVGTAETISGKQYGTFDIGYSEKQKPISLPNNTALGLLSGYASAGGFNFTAPNPSANTVDQAKMRIEFVARPYNGGAGGGATGLPINGADDGFFRVYVSKNGATWLRGDSTIYNCGATYVFTNVGTGLGSPSRPAFVPLSEQDQDWFSLALNASPIYADSSSLRSNLTSGNASTRAKAALQRKTARCYLGGDPNLRAVSYRAEPGSAYNTDVQKAKNSGGAWIMAAVRNIAGDSTTFYPGTVNNSMGYWTQYPGAVAPQLSALWPTEAPYLFPLYRGLNPGTKGVIYVSGTTGVSGALRGRVTLYATGSVAILRDTKYVTDPSLNNCTADMLGIISGHDIMIADNAPQDPLNVAGAYRNMDDTKDVFLQGVMMALNTAFGVENYSSGPTNANDCDATNNGRGCLFLTGGIIQKQRGAVGVSNGAGFAKRYSYDKCALYNPPPYFPTTGRYTDNRYYEIDPSGFDVAALYHSLTP